MFDIGFLEILLIAVLGLVVIGPQQLPATIKTVAIWFSRFKRSINEARAEFEQQIGADEIRREIHNQQVMDSMRKFEEQRAELENKVHDFKKEVASAAETADTNSAQPDASDPWQNKNLNKPAGEDKPAANHSETESPHNESDENPDHKNKTREPEPHTPMIHDESGEDVSELPGRQAPTAASDEDTDNKHGK